MTLTEFLAFGKILMDRYDAIVTPEEDAAFRADLVKWSTFALNALGANLIAFLTTYFTAQITKLQAEIAKLTAKKAK